MTIPGYTRDPKVTAQLIEALRAALYANPDQRLGQLLTNTARREDGSQSDLWNIHDEDWIQSLKATSDA